MRHAKKLLSLTAVMLVAACTDNSILNPRADAAGTYQLTVYAGKSIPAHYVIQPGDPDYPQYPNGATFDVVDGELVLNSNGTFSETNNYVLTPTGGSPLNRAFFRTGTWTLNGNDLALDTGNNSGGIHDTGTLTIDANGRYVVNYLEGNGVGGFDPFEYKRF